MADSPSSIVEKKHPDFAEAFALLALLHDGAGNVELRAKTPDGQGVHNQFFALPLDTAAAAEWLGGYAGRRNLYYGIATRGDAPHPSNTGKLSGGADNCIVTVAAGIDLDLHDEALFPAAVAALHGYALPASVIVHTGRGLQALWLIKPGLPLDDKGAAALKHWQKALYAAFKEHKADPNALDVARVFRLPGTVNMKNGAVARLLFMDPARRYRPAEFGAVFGEPAPEAERPRPEAVSHSLTVAQRQEIAKAVLAKHPPAVEGESGRDVTYEACCVAAHGCDLSPEQAWDAMQDWNATCRPPWTKKDLLSKLRDAENKAHGRRGERLQAYRRFPLSETGDAECFAEMFSDRVRYHHRDGAWLVFKNGVTWQRDPNGELHRLAVEMMRSRQAAALLIADTEERKRALAWYIGGESVKRTENMLKAARSVLPIAETGDGWDEDPWLLGARNGVVDLRTGALREGRPEDRITRQVAVDFDPAAKCPTWEKAVAQIFGDAPDLAPFVQRALGYSLTGDAREECLFFAHGSGRNGKGTIMNTVAWLMGSYADNLAFSALEQIRFKGNGPTPEIAKLPGIRFLTSSESDESSRLNTARIKSITGRDPVTCRHLHKSDFTFIPAFKLWLAANDLPQVADDSDGFWARVRMIPFTRTFAGKEDLTLKDRLRAEGPGILAWMVRGCVQWQGGGLQVPKEVVEATSDYRTESDKVARFCSERLEDADGKRTVTMAAAHKAYVEWCDVLAVPPWERVKVKKFSAKLRAMYKDRVGEVYNVVHIFGARLRSGATGEI